MVLPLISVYGYKQNVSGVVKCQRFKSFGLKIGYNNSFSRLNSSQYQQSPPSSKLSKSNRVSSERSTSQSSPSSEQSSSRQKSLPLSIYCMRKI